MIKRSLPGVTVPVLALVVGGCNLVLGLQPATLDAGTGGGTATTTSVTATAGSSSTSATGGSSCSDGAKNGAETDIDCGGDACNPCVDGGSCKTNFDCQSKVCSLDECLPPACTVAPCSGDTLFAERAGDVGDEVSRALATDGTNIYITGSFGGKINFGGGSLTSIGSNDLYLARLDANGHQVWATQFGDAGNHYGESLVADSEGNVVMTGEFTQSVDFQGSQLVSAGGQDGFLAKFSASAQHLWSKRFGGQYDQFSESVALDKNGNILVIGSNEGTIDFGGGPITNPTAGILGGSSVFVAKFNSSGDHLWSKGFGNGEIQYGISIVADSANNVFILADGGGTFNFGGGVLTSNGGDIFIAKFDADGNHLWSRQFGNASMELGSRLAVDAFGNIFVLAQSDGSINFGGGNLTAAGAPDIFVAKLDTNGNHVWSRRFGHPGGGATGVGLDVDLENNVFVTGRFLGQIDFGGGPLISAGKRDLFVAKLSPKGTHLWSRRFGDAEDQYATGTVFADGLVITGYFAGSLDFGLGPLVSAGGTDVFVAKLYP